MNSSALTLQPNRSQKVLGDAYLKFQLAQGVHSVLAMKQVQEVLILPMHRLTPMPNMPACVLGLMNRRSHVMWVVDLAQMLGMPALDANSRQHNLVIVRVGTITLALAVQRVGGISWINSNNIQQPPGHTTSQLLTYLRGCVLQDQEVVLVLDAEAIIQSSVFHNP